MSLIAGQTETFILLQHTLHKQGFSLALSHHQQTYLHIQFSMWFLHLGTAGPLHCHSPQRLLQSPCWTIRLGDEEEEEESPGSRYITAMSEQNERGE